jgi:HIV Tat-specific factor 1
MRKEAEKIGDVTNVTLYDKEPEGIVAIRFREFDAAEECRDTWNGRHYGYKWLEVTLAEERPRFQKTKRENEKEKDEWKLFKIAQD